MTPRADAEGDAGFEHHAVLVGAPDELRRTVLPRLRADAAAGGHVVVAVADPMAAELRGGLAGADGDIRFTDPGELYEAPGRTLAALRRLARSGEPARTTLLGQPPLPVDDPVGLREWQRLDSVLTTALAGTGMRLLCLHDAPRLPGPVLDAARHTHPLLTTAEGPIANRDHVDPEAFSAADVGRPLPPPTGPRHTADIRADLPALREEITRLAAAAGLTGDRAGDLVVAANELAANVLEHGAGKGGVTVWRRDGWVVCDVFDERGGLTDPLSGYLAADPQGPRGYGLWITRQVADYMQVSGGPDGSLVRLHFRAETG